MKDTKIEWADHTANLWSGCTKVSPGCQFCYAEELSRRFPTLGKWGPGAPRVRHTSADAFVRRLNRNRVFRTPQVSRYGQVTWIEQRPPRVFINSLSDWLDDEVPLHWLAELMVLIRECPNVDFLLLTKRPENFWMRFAELNDLRESGSGQWAWESAWHFGDAPRNVWVGTTVEDQTRADERIPALLKIPAKVRFLSCEPLLGSVRLIHPDFGMPSANEEIHWVICGGESGRNARPLHPDWARSLRDQCLRAGVAFFFKQWGEWCPPGQLGDYVPGAIRKYEFTGGFYRCGKSHAGRLLDGREWNEFPNPV